MNIISKYNRSDYIKSTDVNGTMERDLLLSNWDLFEIKRDVYFVYLTSDDIQRPDLFCFMHYNRFDWWWIISKFNNVDDWWNDVFPGMRMTLPHVDDIKNFCLKVQARK